MMKFRNRQPTVKAPPETFTGDAWYDVIRRGDAPSRQRVNVVRFAPGARNAWHAHARGQSQHVTEGTGLVYPAAARSPRSGLATPSDQPGEARARRCPDRFMTHLAIWESPGETEGRRQSGGGLVTDAEYGARPESAPEHWNS
jgi:hypothetical protein